MIVSNNTLLNILLPKNNAVLKDVLKEADTKTLQSLKNGNSSVSDILKDLFEDVKTGNKSNNAVENMLKNSNVFKDLGSFPKALNTLLGQVDSQESLAKYKPLLQSFLKDIANLDEKGLKDALAKSGVFLESKVATQGKNEIVPKNLEPVLNQIRALIKDIPGLEAKKIDSLISKILQNTGNISENTGNIKQNPSLLEATTKQVNTDIKALLNSLQDLSSKLTDKPLQNLNQLTNSLKDITSNAQLLESKTLNQSQSTQAQTQTTQLQNTQGNQGQATQIANSAQVTQQTQVTQNPSNLNQNVQTNQNTNLTNTAQLTEQKQNILTQTKDILFQLKSEVLTNNSIPNKEAIVKLVDNLIQNSNLFDKNTNAIEPKALLTQLTNSNEIKQISTQNQNVANLVNQLKTLSTHIEPLEQKALINQPIVQEKAALTQEIQQNLTNLKAQLANIQTVDTSTLNKVIDRLLNLQNLFTKLDLPQDLKAFTQNLLQNNAPTSTFTSNFASNISELILNLKENITNSSTNPINQQLQTNILKTVDKLESLTNNFNFNNQIFLDKPQAQQNPIQNDMKAVLLQMQSEIEVSGDPKMSETLKQVDRMIMQMDYHQLLSITSNSNSVYLPFVWDMMEEGTISMKQTEEEKFYCEINLKLKEFGDTSLLLGLYDKNKLDLTIYASKDEFKEALRLNLSKLKQALNSVELIPMNIKIIDMNLEKKEKEAKPTNIYEQNNEPALGVDIRV